VPADWPDEAGALDDDDAMALVAARPPVPRTAVALTMLRIVLVLMGSSLRN
jgi:replicative DNA helicase